MSPILGNPSVLGKLGLVLTLPLRESSKSLAWFLTSHCLSTAPLGRELCQCLASWLGAALCRFSS